MAKNKPVDQRPLRQPLPQRPAAAPEGAVGAASRGLTERGAAPASAQSGLGALGYAAEVSALFHDQLGNQLVQDTLRGPDEVGLEGFIAVELSSAVAGLQGDQAALSSNEALLRHLGPSARETMTAAEALRVARASAGAPLPDGLRERLEGALGRDLSHVRVHVGGAADRAARGVNALAFTVGRDIYFRSDAWAPGTEEGDRVLLHELTHVAQEDDGRVAAPQAGADLSRPSDPLEREASQAEAPGLAALAELDDSVGGWDEGVSFLQPPLETGHDPGGEAPSAAALMPRRDPLHLLPTQPQDLLERVRRVGSLPPAVRQQLERALGEPSEALRAGGEALERLMGVGEALLGEPVQQLDPLQAAMKGVFSAPETRAQADGDPQKSPLDAVIGAVLTPHSTEDGGDSVPQEAPPSVASNHPELVGGAEDTAGGPKLSPVAEQLVQGGRRLRGELQGLTAGVMRGLGVPSSAEEELRAGIEPVLSGLIASMERAASRFGAQMNESGDGGPARGEVSQPSASALHEPAPGQALVANGPQGAPASPGAVPTQINAQTCPGDGAAPSPLVALTERLRGFPQRLVEGLGDRERVGGSLASVLSIPVSDEGAAPAEQLLNGLMNLVSAPLGAQETPEEAAPQVEAAPAVEATPSPDAPGAEVTPTVEDEDAALQQSPKLMVEDAALQHGPAPETTTALVPPAAPGPAAQAVTPPGAATTPVTAPTSAPLSTPESTPSTGAAPTLEEEVTPTEPSLVDSGPAALPGLAPQALPPAPGVGPSGPATTPAVALPPATPSAAPFDAAALAERLGAESARRLHELAELAREEEVAAQQETEGSAEEEADPAENLIQDPLAALQGREPVTDQLLGALTGDSGAQSQVIQEVQAGVMASIPDAPRAEPQSTTPVDPMSPELALAGLGDRLASVLDGLPGELGDPFAALADRNVRGKVKADAGDMAAVGREAFMRHVGGDLGLGRFDELIRAELLKSSPPHRADQPAAPATSPAATGPTFSGAQLLNRLGATASPSSGAPPAQRAEAEKEEAPAAAPSTLPPAAELEGAAKTSEAGIAGIGATLDSMVRLVSDGAMLQANLGESELLSASGKLREQLLGAASAAPTLVAPLMPDLASGFGAEAAPKLSFGAEEAGIKAELPEVGSILPQGGLGGEGLTRLLSLEGRKIAPIAPIATPLSLQAPAADMAPKTELDAVVAQSFADAESKVSAGMEALTANTAESAVTVEAAVTTGAEGLTAAAAQLTTTTDEVVATNIAELTQSHAEAMSASAARNSQSAASVIGLADKGAAAGDKLAQDAGKTAKATPKAEKPKVGPDAEAFAADPGGANVQLGRDVEAQRRDAETHLADVEAQDPERALSGEVREAVLREAKGVPEEKLALAQAQEGEAALKEVAEEEPEVEACADTLEEGPTADDAEAVEEEGAATTGADEEQAVAEGEEQTPEEAAAEETAEEAPAEEGAEEAPAEEEVAEAAEAEAPAETATSEAPAEGEVSPTDAAVAEDAVAAAPETMASALSPDLSPPIPSPNFGAMLAGAGLGVALGEGGLDLLGALDLSLGAQTTPMELGLDGLTGALSALGPMLDEKAVADLAAQLDPTAAVGAAQDAAKAKLAAAAAQLPAAADAAAAESNAALQHNLNQQAAAAESQAAASADNQHAAVDSGAAAQSADIGAQLSEAEAAEQARVAAEQQVVAELLAAREASIEAQRPPIVSQITTVGQTQAQAREQEGEVQEQASEVTKEGLIQQVDTLKTAQVQVLEQTATQAKTELAAEVTQRKAELKQQAEQLKQQIEEKFKTEVQNLDKAVQEGTTKLQTQKTENDAKVKAETQTKIQERRVAGARAAREAMRSIIEAGRAQQQASYARAEEHRASEYAKADAVLAEAQARFAQIMAEANAMAASSNPLEKFSANAIYGRANGVLADGEAKAAAIRANGDSTCASMKAEADAQMVAEVNNANKQFDAMMQQTEMAIEQLRAAEQQALQANEQLLKAGLDQLKQEREMAFQRADQQRRYAIIGVDSDVAIGEMKIEEEKVRAEQEIQKTLDAAKTALETQCNALKEQINSAHQSNLQQIQAQVNTAKSEIQAAVQEAQAQVQEQVVTARQEMRVVADERIESMVQESAHRIVRFQTEARTGVARVQRTAEAYHGRINEVFHNQLLPGLRTKQNEIVQHHRQNMAEMKAGAIAGAEARNRYYAGQINDQALKSASWSNNQIEQFRAGADGDLGRVAELNMNMMGEHYTNFQDAMGKRVFENNTIYRDFRSDLYEKGTQLADMLAQEGAAQAWEKGGPAGVAVGFLFLGVNAVAQGGRYHLEKQMIRNAVDIGGPGLLGVPLRVDQNGNAVPDILTLKDDQILRQFGFRNYLMAGPNGPVPGLRLPDGRVVSRASLSQDPRASTAVLGAMSDRFTQDGGPLISQQENIQDTLVYTGTKLLSDTVQAGKSYAENRLSSSGAFKGLTQDPGAMVAYAVGKGALWSAIDQGSDSLTSWMRGEGDLSALAQRNFTERFFEGWAAETVGEISGGIMERAMGSAGRKLSRVIPQDVQNRIAESATNAVMRQAVDQLGEVMDRLPFARTLIREGMDFLGSLPEEVFSESLSNFSSNLVTGIRTGELQKAFEEYQRTGDASALMRQRDALLKGVFDGEALESAVTESLNEKVTGRLGDRMGNRRDAQMTQRDNDRLQSAVASGNTQEINRLIDQINRSTDARVDNLNDQLPRLLQSAPPQVQEAVRQRLQADNQRVTDQRAAIDARQTNNTQSPLRLSRSTVGVDADSAARTQSRNDVDQLVQATQRSDAAAINGLLDLVQQGSPRRAETIARNLPELLQSASPEVQAQVRERVQREAEAAAALLARQRQGYRVEVDAAAAQRLITLNETLNPGEPAATSPASAANPDVATPNPDTTQTSPDTAAPNPDVAQTTPTPSAPEATTTPDTPDPAQDLDAAAAVVRAFETALPNEIAAVVRDLYDNGAGLDAVVAQMDALVASASPEAKAAMGRQLMTDGHAWQANPDGYDKDVVARMMTLGRAYADATARLGQDPYGNQIKRTLSVITEDYSAFKERLQEYQANIGAWTDMDLPYTMWTYFGNIARYEGTEVNVFAPEDGVRAVAPTYDPETGDIGFAQNDDGSLRQSVTVKEIESAGTLVMFGIDPSSGEITIQDGIQYNLGMNKALSMASPAPAPEVEAPESEAQQTPAETTPATTESGVQLSLLNQAPALAEAFETGNPMAIASAVLSLYETGAGLDAVVAQMDALVASASPEAKAAMGRQLMTDGHAWQANPDGYDKDVVARMMTLGRAYADATARLGQDPYGNQIKRTLSVITEDYSAFKERLQEYQANIGAWTDMDLPYTMWTYFGNIARYEGTEVNVFAPEDGVRAVAPTYNPETGDIGFAQNDDGSLRQSVTVKEIESAGTLVMFGIDPSSGQITIQDGIQYNLGMNKALSMANPSPAPEVEAPESEAQQTLAETTPAATESGVQLSLLDRAPQESETERSTRDIGLAPETDASGRKATVVGNDHNQSPPAPDLSVTPPEESAELVYPTVGQENVATAPPSSPLFQQLRGIVASMLYDVPEAAPAIAETMGLSPEGLQILRDNDNAATWADLTAAGLSDADRAALQHAAALKLVSTLDPDQPASLFLSWFDWHIGTQADFNITQPHLQNAINMDNAGMDEVAAVMGVANFKRLVLSTHGLPGGQIMKTEEGSGFNIYDARIMAEIAERAGVSSVLLAHCYGALGADGVNTLDVDSRQASGSSIAEFSSRGMDVSAYEGAVNTRTATQMVGVWSELIAAGVPDEAALQLAGAFANATGGENLNSIDWSQYVSHARAELGPEGDPQAWANRNGFVDTQIRGKRVGPEQILQLLTQYGDVLLATQGAQDAPKAWKGRIPENQVDLLARMTVNDLIYGGLYPQQGLTGADAQMIVTLLGQAWSGAPLVQNGALPEWAELGARLYFALEGQVAAIQHMDPAERAQRAHILQNLQIMRDEVWIQLAAAGQAIVDAQGQLAFLPPTDLTHYATSDTTATSQQSPAPTQVDGVTVADVTQIHGDTVSVDPNAPVQALLFDLAEVEASTARSLPTPGLVGGVTTPAAPQGDDRQRRQDVLAEARAYFKPMLGALLARAATQGTGMKNDRALNGLTSAVAGQLDTFRRSLGMKGLDGAWVTTDAVLDMLARDTELARALQEATPGLGVEPGQLLAVMDPAHRLATQLKDVKGDGPAADDTRLGLLRDTLHRTDGALLLTGQRGGELLGEVARIKDPVKRALAMEMLQTGQALALGDQGGAPKVERVTRSLDGAITREAAALATELSVLATSLDTKNPRSAENGLRLAAVRARVADALRDLRDLQSRLNDPNLSDTDRQALEAKRAEMIQAATKVNAVVTRSGSLLSTLALHDNAWFGETLLPYLREAGASPPSASVTPQSNAQTEAFWARHKLDAAAMSARKPDDLQRRLDQLIQEASGQGPEGRALLLAFARRYSQEHGSFYKLLNDAFNAHNHSFESTPGKNDPAVFRAMAHAFGVETSDAFEGVDFGAAAQPITLEEEVRLVRLVTEAAEKIHASFKLGSFTSVTAVMRELLGSATVISTLQKLERDPAKRAEILQRAVRAAFKEGHGDLAARLTKRALEASWVGGESPDAQALGYTKDELLALHAESEALGFKASFQSREDRLQEHYDRHPNVAQTRLAADKRLALFVSDPVVAIEGVLKLSAEDRLKALNDPLLTAELATKHGELWPFMRQALEGRVPPQEMLSVLLALKQAVSLGLKPGEVMKAATEALPKGDVLGLGKKILTTMGKSVSTDVLQRAQQRMQPEMQKVVEGWASWRAARLQEQDPTLKDDKAELARRQQAEALDALADPDLQALLRDHFSAEQRASITSVMLSGSTSGNDKAQQSRLGIGVDAKNVLAVIQKAYEDGKTEALRQDPAVLAQLQKLGEGERQIALQLLFDTPAAKALSVMKVQGDLSNENAVALLGKLATLTVAERDAIRDDPALVLLLSKKLKGEHLARFQRLMQLNGRSEAEATTPGQNEQDRERAWLRLRAVEGVKTLINAKDDKALIQLAVSLFKAKVSDPNAQAPSFAERAQHGERAGDLSAQDRPMMAEALRSSAEYAELLKRNPTLAAAVMDAVLGQRDPTPMLYHAEAARSWLSADVDGMVKAIEKVSAEELLTQFVDLDAFAPVLLTALTAREALAALPADASDDQRQAAEKAVADANMAMRAATFDLSASRLAELSSLSKADQQKVLDAVRARVNKLLGGEAKDELALVARALQASIGRVAPQSGLTVDETLMGEISSADRLARSQLAQAQTDMARSRKAVESVAALLPRFAVKLPGGLDLKKGVEEANQALQAWADALAAASQSDAPLTEDQRKLLKERQEAAEKAKKALTESFDKVVATASKHLNTAFETALNSGEAALITAVTFATGGVGTVPVTLVLGAVKPALKKLVGLWIDRALRDEQRLRRADIAPAIVEVIKENVNEGWKQTLEGSPLVGLLAEGLAQIVALNLPFIDGKAEDAADKKISGQIEGQTKKLETLDDALLNQAGGLLNRQNRRQGPAEAGGDVYGDSVSREQELVGLRQGVKQRLEERAKQRGLKANDPVVTKTAEALQATLGDGDVSRLEALVTEHGVEKMQGLLHNVVRPEDDAKLEDKISAPLRQFLQDLAARGPGGQAPGAVGGLSAATPELGADEQGSPSANTTQSGVSPAATSLPAAAPEGLEGLEARSGRSLRAGNAAGLSDRAAARLSSLAPDQAAEVQALLTDPGVSPSARALLERGLAAGYSLSELRLLRDLTVNRADAELIAEFTGLGLSQIGQVSCLPTAYQIAIAEQDPLYAYRLRQNPQAMSTQDGGGGLVFTQAELEQLRALRERGGETSMASMPLELARLVLPALRAKGIDPASREALAEVDRVLASLGAPVQSGTQGLDVTQFTQDAELHKILEARVGRDLALVPMNLNDVQSALTQGHPVPVLTTAESLMGDRRVEDAHAQVILSFDGERYTVHDPQGGGVRQLTAAELQRELGARWALLPTGAAVAPQAPPAEVDGSGADPLQSAAEDADLALQAALGDPDAEYRPHRGSSADWCFARLQRMWQARLVSLGLAEEELPKAEAVRAGLEEAIFTGRPTRLRAAMRDAGPILARRIAGEVLPGTPVPKEHSAAIQAAVEDASRGVAR